MGDATEKRNSKEMDEDEDEEMPLFESTSVNESPPLSPANPEEACYHLTQLLDHLCRILESDNRLLINGRESVYQLLSVLIDVIQFPSSGSIDKPYQYVLPQDLIYASFN
jgi:hypothetical protein